MKITKREFKIFIVGVLSGMLISFLLDFHQNVNSFKEGFEDGWNAVTK